MICSCNKMNKFYVFAKLNLKTYVSKSTVLDLYILKFDFVLIFDSLQ